MRRVQNKRGLIGGRLKGCSGGALPNPPTSQKAVEGTTAVQKQKMAHYKNAHIKWRTVEGMAKASLAVSSTFGGVI